MPVLLTLPSSDDSAEVEDDDDDEPGSPALSEGLEYVDDVEVPVGSEDFEYVNDLDAGSGEDVDGDNDVFDDVVDAHENANEQTIADGTVVLFIAVCISI